MPVAKFFPMRNLHVAHGATKGACKGAFAGFLYREFACKRKAPRQCSFEFDPPAPLSVVSHRGPLRISTVAFSAYRVTKTEELRHRETPSPPH